MPIPPGTKFHGVAPGVDTENRGSKRKNSDRQAYTIEEMGVGGGGGTFTEDIQYNLTGNLSFGRLTGSGTYPVPAEGVTVVDFIKDVLVAGSANFSATPTPAWLYNLTDIDVNVTGQYGGGASAVLSRTINGGDVEVIETDILPGSFSILDNSIPTFSQFTSNYIRYFLNIFDDDGNQILQRVALVNQQPYAAPTVTIDAEADDSGRSPDSSDTLREWGNTGSAVNGEAFKLSSLVEMTQIRLYKGNTELVSTNITGDPGSVSESIQDNAPAREAATYTCQISDAQSDNDTDDFANQSVGFTVNMCPPMLFVASPEDGSTKGFAQGLYDGYAAATDGYFKLFVDGVDETFSTVANMADTNNYAWVMVEASLGPVELRQGGPDGPIVNFENLGLGAQQITNDFGETFNMICLRSPFTGPFSEGTNFYIKTNG